jgi:hypothetical protein
MVLFMALPLVEQVAVVMALFILAVYLTAEPPELPTLAVEAVQAQEILPLSQSGRQGLVALELSLFVTHKLIQHQLW